MLGRVGALDWPTYQHDYQRSGITAESLDLPLAQTWVYQSPHRPSPAWSDPAKRDYYLSAGSQKPLQPRLAFDRAFHVVIAGDSLFFGSSTEHTINCCNAVTASRKWSYFTDGPVRMAPTVHEGRVYAGSDDGSVYCLEARDGTLLWKQTPAGAENYLVPNDGKFVSPFAIRSSVAVEDGIAYFTAGFFPHEGVYLCAVDAVTGQQTSPRHWKRKLLNQAALQGYILLSATRIYMPGSRSNPFFFDRATGSTLGQFSGAMGTYALLAGSSFIFGPAARGGAQLTEGNATGDTLASHNSAHCLIVSANRSYLLGDTSLTAIDRATARPLWTKAAAYPYALIMAGQTLIAGGNNAVAAFDAASGAQIWTHAVQGRAYGLAVANGQLVVSTDQGAIHCFSADQSRQQSVWILF